jgi:hypothetical protein
MKSRAMRWAGHVARMGAERKVYKVLVLKARRKDTTWGRPRHRWENGIRMNFGEIGRGCVEWIKLAQGRGRCDKPMDSDTTELVNMSFLQFYFDLGHTILRRYKKVRNFF